MTSDGEDSLSRWCITNDLSQSIWLKNEDAYNLLMKEIQPVNHVTFDEIVEKSENFPIEFPIDVVKCQELQKYVSRENLERYINSVYPVMHEKVLQLCAQFLLEKRSNGTAIEKTLYKDMDVVDLIDRLLIKRAVVFMGRNDSHMLLDRTTGSGRWETIGTDKELPPLILQNCLSYDEVKLSAYLSVSSYTHYLNIGNRKNEGVYCEDRKNIEDSGIIIGLIGPRFRRKNAMDDQDIVHDKKSKGGLKTFTDFFEEEYFNYGEIAKKQPNTRRRFEEFATGSFFDDVIYAKRLALSFDALLFEANSRAREKVTSAYIHVVGIGLGVWRISAHQNELFVKTFADRIEGVSFTRNSGPMPFFHIRTKIAGLVAVDHTRWLSTCICLKMRFVSE